VAAAGAKAEGKSCDKSTVINWEALQCAIQTSKGRCIMLFDTRHSGNAFTPCSMTRPMRASPCMLRPAETLAQERPVLGHEVFTYAMIEGLNGSADLSHDNFIKAQELSTYVEGAADLLPVRPLRFRHLEGPEAHHAPEGRLIHPTARASPATLASMSETTRTQIMARGRFVAARASVALSSVTIAHVLSLLKETRTEAALFPGLGSFRMSVRAAAAARL
jgi:uncharacterized caspase-like protein